MHPVRHPTRFRVAVLFAATLVATPALAADDPIAIIEGWIKSANDATWLKTSLDSVHRDAASGTTTVDNLSVRIEVGPETFGNNPEPGKPRKVGYTFTLPSVSFVDLKNDDGYYSASSITADTVNLDFEIQGANSAHTTGTYHDLAIRNPRWAIPPDVADDPAHPVSRFYPLVAALVDISASKAEVGAVEAVSETAEPAMRTSIRYDRAVVNGIEHGNFASGTIDGVKVMVDPQPGNDVASPPKSMVSIGPIRLEGYNYGDFIRLFDPATAGNGAGEPETIISSSSMEDLRVKSPEASIALARGSVEGLTARHPSFDVLGWADRMVLDSQAGKKPDEKELAKTIGDIYAIFGVGRFEMSGLAFDSDQAKGKLETTGFAGLSSDGLDKIWFNGLDARGPRGAIAKLGAFSVNGIGFPALDALVGFKEAQSKGDIVTMLAAMPVIKSTVVKDLYANVPDQGEFSLGSSGIVLDGQIGPVPTRAHFDAKGLKMPVSALEPEQRQPLEAMGYDTVNLSYALDLVWSKIDDAMDISGSVELKDGGKFDLDGRLGSIPRLLFENPLTAPAIAQAITLVRTHAKFADDSLKERAISMAAKQQNLDPELVKTQALGILPFMLAALQRPDFANMVSAAAARFLNGGGSIEVNVAPPAPVPLAPLVEEANTDPGKLVDSLNVTVKAK